MIASNESKEKRSAELSYCFAQFLGCLSTPYWRGGFLAIATAADERICTDIVVYVVVFLCGGAQIGDQRFLLLC